MNKPIRKEQCKIGQNEISTFTKIRNDVFYKQTISKDLKSDGFGIYVYLCSNKNMLNDIVVTNIEMISSAMKYTNVSRKKESICKCLIKLKELNYIDFNFNISYISKNSILEIKIREYSNHFLKLYNDDYLLFERLKPNQFMVYMMLRSYYNKEQGYSYPTLLQISKFTNISKTTVVKILEEFVYLELINIDNSGWKKITEEKFQRSNNIYTINFEGKKEFIKNTASYEDTKKMLKNMENCKKTPKENVDKINDSETKNNKTANETFYNRPIGGEYKYTKKNKNNVDKQGYQDDYEWLDEEDEIEEFRRIISEI